MIITISGKAGSGKSTIAKHLAKELHLKHYSIGDIMRKMAKEHKMSIIQLNKKAETDPSIDKELDDNLISLGKEEDDFIIDGRLTAHFIPHADFRIFLDASPEIRAQRILHDKRELEKNTSLKKTLHNMKTREESEIKRYAQYYGVDFTSPELYTLTLDTTHLDIPGVVEQILGQVKSKVL